MVDTTIIGMGLNTGLFGFRRFKKKPWVQPAWFPEERLAALPQAIIESGAHFFALQEMTCQDHKRDVRREIANNEQIHER